MIGLYIFLGFLVLSAFYGIGIYNRLVKLSTLVDEAWSGIDVQLKKRYNLIPNLVETVKGYASHEKETFENVTKARSQAQNATTVDEQQAAENQLNKALINLYAVAEQYPELKANENFLNLQNELSVIEGDIEKSRRYYNGTTRDYNILIDSFPSNIVAGLTKFEKAAFFEIEMAAERENPQVKF
ncbi:LemA family protein [Winogradskyella aquimaris]|uniref:LemA family protein n=1 Tax=Winogradskyella aquimaris TaxID=864074 RepID=A0ABU5EPY5_9FLAO|nr:LemA family protein [Winogradskyella aquimaris]MDY2588343.1 LemA family protein [Winogradskyella aquimaris]